MIMIIDEKKTQNRSLKHEILLKAASPFIFFLHTKFFLTADTHVYLLGP